MFQGFYGAVHFISGCLWFMNLTRNSCFICENNENWTFHLKKKLFLFTKLFIGFSERDQDLYKTDKNRSHKNTKSAVGSPIVQLELRLFYTIWVIVSRKTFYYWTFYVKMTQFTKSNFIIVFASCTQPMRPVATRHSHMMTKPVAALCMAVKNITMCSHHLLSVYGSI